MTIQKQKVTFPFSTLLPHIPCAQLEGGRLELIPKTYVMLLAEVVHDDIFSRSAFIT